MAISLVGSTTLAAGTGAVSVNPNAILSGSVQQNDFMVLFVESENQDIATPSGWTQIGTAQGTGTARAATAARLEVFYKFAGTSESSFNVADSGDHTSAFISVFRDVDLTSPINVVAGDTGASSTSVTIPSVTTTVANCVVIAAVASSADTGSAQASAWTNANLTGFAEFIDGNTTSADGGGIAAAYGVKATAGATGTSTATLAAASLQARLCFALTPWTNKRIVGTAAGTSDLSARSPSTRLYLGADTFVTISPTIALDSVWNDTTTSTYKDFPFCLGKNKLDPADNFFGGILLGQIPYNYIGDIPTSPDCNAFMVRCVSKPLTAQTISGNVYGQILGEEYSSTNNAVPQMVLKVVSNDGSIVRGVLVAADTSSISAGQEFPPNIITTGKLGNRYYPRAGVVSLTPLDVEEGDRLVLEIGVLFKAYGSAPIYGIMTLASQNNMPDAPSDNTTEYTNTFPNTTLPNPWIEFNDIITFQDEVVIEPLASVASNLDSTVSVGTSIAWTNTTNISASDNTYATVLLPNSDTSFYQSDYLVCSGFDLSSLPVDSTMVEAYLIIEGKATSGTECLLGNFCFAPDTTLLSWNSGTGYYDGAYYDLSTSIQLADTDSDIKVPMFGLTDPVTTLPHIITADELSGPNAGFFFTAYNQTENTDSTASIDGVRLYVKYTIPAEADFPADGSASGASTVSGVSRSLNKQAGSAAGTSTVSGIGKSLNKSVANAAGLSSVLGVGRKAIAGIGTLSGTSSLTAVSFVLGRGYGSIVGSSTISGVSKSTAKSVGSSVGTAIAAAGGRSLNKKAGSLSGTSTVSGVGKNVKKTVGSSVGLSSMAGIGKSLNKATGASTSSSTVSGASRVEFRAVGASTSTSVLNAAGQSQNRAVASSAGTSAFNAVGQAAKRIVGTLAGSSTAQGYITGLAPMVGSITGSSTISASTITAMKTAGTLAGEAATTGVSNAIARSDSQIEGLGLTVGRTKYNKDVPVPKGNLILRSGANRFGYSVIKFSGEPVPLEHMEDAQKLEADAYIDLFQIVLSDKQTKLYLKMSHDVTWQGNHYEGTGIKIDGVATYASEEVSRPKLTLFNPEGVYSSLVDDGLLDGAKVVRYRVLKADIDNDRPIYRVQQWKVSRIADLRVGSIVVELRDLMDGQTFMVPYRMFIPPDFPTVSIS